jgi:outer membrane protein assembly factor BamA
VDEAQLPGFYRGLRLVRIGGGLGLDLRKPARDGGGFSVAVDGTFAEGLAGDPSRHLSTSAEAVASVGGNDKLFLLRARAAMVEPLTVAPIPFEELVIPSGLRDMRGLPDGRLRDRSAVMASAEYRWYISAYLDATLFVDVGTVAGPRFAGLDWSRYFPSFGLGFRFYQPNGPYWEAHPEDGIQIAYAPEGGIRLLLSLAAF